MKTQWKSYMLTGVMTFIKKNRIVSIFSILSIQYLANASATFSRNTAFEGYSEGPFKPTQKNPVTRSEVMVFSTHYGDIRVFLRQDAAPKTVEYMTDCCLIPESPFYLEGKGGLYEFIETRLRENGHMVIVVAEGAGQELVAESMQNMDSRDASGNRLLLDVGLWLSHNLKNVAREGLFDGCSFYRAEPSGETVDQGREGTRRGYALVQGGLYSCGRQQSIALPRELVLQNNVGTVALITGTSEFFFNLEHHHDWDTSFNVWGTILNEESLVALQKIVMLPTYQEEHPSGTVMRILKTPVEYTVKLE